MSPEGVARGTRLIFAGAALGTTGLFAAFTVAPLIARELTGSSAWSGIPGAIGVAGTAAGAAVLSAVMGRRGRASGLRLGYLVGLAGAVVTVGAAALGSFLVLLAGMALVGVGHSSNQLARFAAADPYPVERRAAIVGWIVWAATVGAVLGPTLPGLMAGLARALDLSEDAAGFLVAVLFFVGAFAVTGMLRTPGGALDLDPTEVADRLRALIRLPRVRRSLVALVTAQTTMVLVMTITPLHVRGGDHGLGIVGAVMSAHFVGMFALAPVAGRLTGRVGARPMMLGGLSVLLVAAVGAGLSGNHHAAPVAWWLFLLGIGWSATFVAGSAALTHGLGYRARVKVQGGVDAIAWTSSAIASACSGVLFDRFGYGVLSLVGAAIVVLPLLWIAAARATPEPARA